VTADDDFIPEPKLLDANDRASLAWRKLKAHLEQRLQALRVKNDNDLDPISTAHTRGLIKGVKDMLALGESPAPAPEADAD
jgi:hypothetical protein